MKKFIVAVFVIYMALLIKLVLFKGRFFYKVVPSSTEYERASATATFHTHNFIPFRTIRNFLTAGASTSTLVKLFNLVGNIALFLPLGFLLPLLFKKMRFRYAVMSGAALSLCFELYQLVTRTGEFDVDDIILNTLGTIIGYALFTGLRKLYRPTVSAT